MYFDFRDFLADGSPGREGDMRQVLRTVVNCVVYTFIFYTCFAVGQPPSTANSAPIPSALIKAKKVFISNAGADSGLFPHPFSGGHDRAYNQFYTSMQALGRYELVANPTNADLVFELQLTAPNGPQSADKTKGASDPLPMFRLVIFDGPTHYILWALTESISPANLQKTHDHNFDEALAALSADLATLTTRTPSGTL
jgi:hypothetical protein